jgi:hypothetical protein
VSVWWLSRSCLAYPIKPLAETVDAVGTEQGVDGVHAVIASTASTPCLVLIHHLCSKSATSCLVLAEKVEAIDTEQGVNGVHAVIAWTPSTPCW